MTEHFNNDIWTDPQDLRFEERNTCAEPLGTAISAVAKRHIDPDMPLVEIGSGTGALDDYYSHDGSVIHVEGSAALLPVHAAKLAENRPEDTIVQADLYNLPFASNSVEQAVGLLVLDGMTDAEAAFDEIHRVLRPNGTFTYMHDLVADNTALNTMLIKEGQVPVPYSSSEHPVERLALFTPDGFEQLRVASRAMLAPILHLTHALELISQGGLNTDTLAGHPDIVKALAYLVVNTPGIERTITPPISTYFFDRLENLATQRNMRIVERGVGHATETVDLQPVDDRWEIWPVFNHIEHGHEGFEFKMHPGVPDDKVRLGASVLTLVVQK